MPQDDLFKTPGVPRAAVQSAADQSAGKTYIIAIGIDRYGGHLTDVRDFNGTCELDCSMMVKILKARFQDFEAFKAPLLNEAATFKAINDLIDDFIYDRVKNQPWNNLLIYFSGHGHVTSRGENDPIGCWVPSGCPDLEARYVVMFDDLANKLKGVKTGNFIFVSDSCYSASILNHPEFDPTQNAAAPGTTRWAIVSSRTNEISKAGSAGKNSAFTEVLVQLFSEADGPVGVESIGLRLRQQFAEDDDQKPQIKQFQVRGESNTGSFDFIPQAAAAKRNKWRKMIPAALMTLNFDKQIEKFIEFKKEVPQQFAFFSGTPNCGLGLLLQRARAYKHFPKHGPDKMVAAPFLIKGQGSERILSIFNTALRTDYKNIDVLRLKLLEKLTKQQSLVIQFEFHPYSEPGKLSMPEMHKKQLLNDIADFVNAINLVANGNKLMLLVVDLEGTDYYAIFGGVEIKTIPAIFMPPISIITDAEADQWYNKFRDYAALAQVTAAQFDELFDHCLGVKLPAILTTTGGSPGLMVREICKELECLDISDTLLKI